MNTTRLAELNRRQTAAHPISIAPAPEVEELIVEGKYQLDPEDVASLGAAEGYLNLLPDPPASTARIVDYLNHVTRLQSPKAATAGAAEEALGDLEQERELLHDRLSKEEQRACALVASALGLPAGPPAGL